MNTLSRKDFLQHTAMAGAAMLLSNLKTLASATDEKKLKVAVIGCGSVSGLEGLGRIRTRRAG